MHGAGKLNIQFNFTANISFVKFFLIQEQFGEKIKK